MLMLLVLNRLKNDIKYLKEGCHKASLNLLCTCSYDTKIFIFAVKEREIPFLSQVKIERFRLQLLFLCLYLKSKVIIKREH